MGGLKYTYVVAPSHFVHPRVGLDVAFKVDVDAFTYLRRIQITPQLQGDKGFVWK